jgi:hypothetical protein
VEPISRVDADISPSYPTGGIETMGEAGGAMTTFVREVLPVITSPANT